MNAGSAQVNVGRSRSALTIPAGRRWPWLARARRRARSALLACCLLLDLPGGAAAGCRPEPVATAPLADNSSFLVFQAAIAGTPVSLLLDTGSDASLLTPLAAERLGLAVDPARRAPLRGTGGYSGDAPNVRLRDLAIGVRALPEVSVPVGDFPTLPSAQPPVAGLVGADLLAAFELDIDVPRHRLGLFRLPDGCAGAPPWPGVEAVPLTRQGRHLLAPVRLAGQDLQALVDTGGRSIALDTAAAARLGVGPAALARDPGGVAAGIDLRPVIYRWHVFPTLAIGATVLRRPVITIEPLADDVLLLGAPFFATRRVWLSYRTARMFIAPPPPAPAAGASAR